MAHTHIDVLEAFNPNLIADPFRWIPKGLMQDLMDNTNETNFPVADQVSGFTNAQIFNTWYNSFVMAELAEILANPSGALNPYGPGNTTNSPIIALGEAWAYHMGHFLADQRYGISSLQADEQGIGYLNNNPVAGLSSHLNLLEDYDPVNRRVADPFWWIPKGLSNCK